MALVEKDEMTTLRSASDSKTTAQSALDDIQLKAVAYAINSAANCGELRVVFQEVLRQTVKDALISNGYTVEAAGIADKERGTIINWK